MIRKRLSFLIWLWLLIPVLLLVYSQRARPTTGLEIRQKLAASLPTDEDVQLRLVDGFRIQGRYAEGIALTQDFVKRYPNSARGHKALLSLSAETGRVELAINSFQQLQAINQVDANDLVSIGSALSTKDPMLAMHHFKKALVLNPDSLEANINLGSVLLEMSREKEARPHLEKAAKIAPQNSTAQVNLGILELRSRRPKVAVEHLTKALKVQPNHLLAQKLLKVANERIRIQTTSPRQ